MPLISDPVCVRLGTPFQVDYGPDMLSPSAIADPPRFDQARAVALHEGIARALVSRLKFSDRQDLARAMAAMMVGAGAPFLAEADAVLPVPMHRGRLWRRRFNQSALLAREIAAISGKTYWPDALLRVRQTAPQLGLRREQRRRNLAGAIEANPSYQARIAGAHLVVIDDVRTTGSTLNACAHMLRKAGATRIDVITFTLVKDS
jgi:ComF family protein